MVNLFKRKTKEEILASIEKRIEKDRQRLIDGIIELDEHYEVPTIGDLQQMSLEELRYQHNAYIQALREDVGE